MNIEVNYLAVLLAAVVNMVLGFLWYSPLLLGNPWMKAMGYTAESIKKAQKTMGPLYGISFVLALVSAYVLNHVIALSMNFFQYEAIMTGLTSGFWMWLGFIMPVQATGVIFSKDNGSKGWKIFWINTGYQLVAALAMGVVLGFFT